MLNRVLPVFLCIVILSLSLWGWVLHRNRTWVEPGQRAMVLIHPATGDITTPLTIAVWHPDKQEVLLLALPDKLLFRASHNSEKYPVNSLPRLAEIEGWSEARWRRELSLQLGVIFDGSAHVSLPQDGFALDELRQEAWQSLVGQRSSTLAVWDRLTWWQGLQKTDSLQNQVLSFEPGWLAADKTLNQAQYDRFARLRLQDETIRNSQWTLKVVNASGLAGDATRQARMLELMGFGVRSVDSQAEVVPSVISTIPESQDLASEGRWARGRLLQLYSDWQHTDTEKLFEEQRVQGNVVAGE